MTQLGAMWIKANLPRACGLDPQHVDMCVRTAACLRVCDREGYGSVLVLIMPQANPERQ